MLLVKCYNGILCACGILHILFALNKYQKILFTKNLVKHETLKLACIPKLQTFRDRGIWVG